MTTKDKNVRMNLNIVDVVFSNFMMSDTTQHKKILKNLTFLL